MVIDWSLLYFHCSVDLSVNPKYSTEPAGRIQFLPRKYISGHTEPKWMRYFPHRFPAAILSTNARDLGQLALVLELNHQLYSCPPCDFLAPMGVAISQDHSAKQSARARTYPCVLWRRRHKVSLAVDSWYLVHASHHFPPPVYRRSCCVYSELTITLWPLSKTPQVDRVLCTLHPL